MYPPGQDPAYRTSPYASRGMHRADELKSTSNSMRDMLSVVTARKTEGPPTDEDEDLLKKAQDEFRRVESWESDWRHRAKEELKFVDGLDHWDAGMKEERRGRPCLTFDRIGPSVDQVVNDARQNPPEAKVSPVGAGADVDLAQTLQGLIRNIDQDSSASIAYLTAYEHAVKIGRGWWRIHFEFEDDNANDERAFYQKIIIKRVRNPFSVYPDPAAEEFDYSDMSFCFITEDISLDLFKRLHPNSHTAGFSNFEGIGDKIKSEWFPNGAVRVAEYWWVETIDELIVQLADGSVMLGSEAPHGASIINKRLRKRRVVKGAKLTGTEVLERWTWPGRWIPIVPVLGKEIWKEDRITLRGMVRPAMDSNLAFDWMMSKEAETIGLTSIAQWLVAEGQMEGYEYQWAQANRKALPFLEYKTFVNGQQVAPPQRIVEGPRTGDIVQAIAHLDEATKTNLSTWNPSLGAPSPEASGRAITARQREADNAHFNYHDNLARSMRHSARIELDLIPHVYNEQRVVSITDPDGSNKQILLNAPMMMKGLQKIFRTQSAARCDVTMGSGPSYASRRAEGGDKLLQLVPVIPGLMQRAPDLVVKALDIPDGDVIADRIRPPDVQAENEGQAPIPPQIQGLLTQQHQMIGLLSAQVTALTDVVKNKVIEIESRERIATQHEEHQDFRAALASKQAIGAQIVEHTHDAMQRDLDRRADLLHTAISVEQDAQQQAQAQQQNSGAAPGPGSSPQAQPAAPGPVAPPSNPPAAPAAPAGPPANPHGV